METGKRKVLLMGWDAADWEHINPLVEEGLMPTLDAFINSGMIGRGGNIESENIAKKARLWKPDFMC